jgi:hypothetical protein
MPEDNLPARSTSARIDRAALERVLARAAELQAKSGEVGESIEEFSEEQLIDLGREVGLSPQHLRQAMAEERTRSALPGDEHGFAVTLFGPGHARASRTVNGNQRETLAFIDRWMQMNELLQVKRHFADRIVWEPRGDLLGNIKRMLNVGGRGYPLTRAHEVSATVVPVDDQRVLVSLDADFSTRRGRFGGELAGATVIGAGATGVLVIMGIAGVIAAAPAVIVPAAAYYGFRGIQMRLLTRAQLSLEQLLDRLERGEVSRTPPTLLGVIAAAALPPRRT